MRSSARRIRKRRRSRGRQGSVDSVGSSESDVTGSPLASSPPTSSPSMPPRCSPLPPPTANLPPPPPVRSWSSDRLGGANAVEESHKLVAQLLVASGLGDCVKTMREQEITLPVLLSLTEADMRELGFTLGKRKRLMALMQLVNEEHTNRERRKLALRRQAAGASPSAAALPTLHSVQENGELEQAKPAPVAVAATSETEDTGAGTGEAGAGAAVVSVGTPGLTRGGWYGEAGSSAGAAHVQQQPVYYVPPVGLGTSPGMREPLLLHVREELGCTLTPIFEHDVADTSLDSWRRSVESVSRRAASVGTDIVDPVLAASSFKRASREADQRLRAERKRRNLAAGGCSPAAKCTAVTMVTAVVIIAALVVIAVVLKPAAQDRHRHHRHHRNHTRIHHLHPAHNGTHHVLGSGSGASGGGADDDDDSNAGGGSARNEPSRLRGFVKPLESYALARPDTGGVADVNNAAAIPGSVAAANTARL